MNWLASWHLSLSCDQVNLACTSPNSPGARSPFPLVRMSCSTAGRSSQGRAGFARRSAPLTARTAVESCEGGKGGPASELDDGQVGNHLEVAQIPGADRVAEVEGGRADQQVRKRNGPAELPRFDVDLRRNLGHGPCERFYWNRRENGIQVFAPPPRLLYCLGAMQAVLEFDHGNGREHDFGFSVLVFKCGQQLTHGP